MVRDTNALHRARLSRLDKIAVFVTERVGTMGFFFIISLWTFSWLLWNILAPAAWRFDPYPAFVLWLFISNLIQLHLMPLIMIGQNIQGRHSELRAKNDFETDSEAKREIEQIKVQLRENQHMLEEILKRVKR